MSSSLRLCFQPLIRLSSRTAVRSTIYHYSIMLQPFGAGQQKGECAGQCNQTCVLFDIRRRPVELHRYLNGFFEIFSSVTVFGLICNWSAITFSHLRFRKLRMQNGTADKIAFKSPFYPYADYLAIVFMVIVLACIAILPDMRISLLISAIWVGVVFVAYKFYT